MSRQYLNAAKALSAVHNGLSLKKYCSKVKVGKTEYALCIETLKYEGILNRLFALIGLNVDTLEVNIDLFKIMAYDILFGSKKIQVNLD